MSDQKWYRLDALSSITAYEIAKILQLFEMTCDQTTIDRLPKDVKRHFQVTDDPTKLKDQPQSR